MNAHPEAASIPAMVWQRVRARGPQTALRKKDRGIWGAVSWAELGARARRIGMALKQAGLRPGERAAVLAEAGVDWICADLGILGAGGVSVGLYPTDPAATVAGVLRDSGAVLLFVENEEQLDKALQVRDACPALRRIVVFDMKGLRDFADPMCDSLEVFAATGDARADDWEQGLAAIGADDLALLAYTAGATGAPKGVMLSHRNVLAVVRAAAALTGQGPGDERLAFLPLCHMAERIFGHYQALYSGTVTNLVESAETVPENLREVRPTAMMAFPRIWAKLHSGVAIAAAGATPVQGALYRIALAAGLRAADAALAGRRAPPWVAACGWLARRLVLGRVRAAMGLDRLRHAHVGAAPVSPELIRWYRALGIELLQVYGLTECGGLLSAMPAGSARPGSVGRVVPPGEVRLSEAGEILLRGPQVCLGYWNRPDLTAAALRDGWLHTGDLGEMADGWLYLHGRTGEVLVTAGGARVAPAAIENRLTLSPYIADAVVVGDGRTSLSCLVMIEHDTVEAWAQSNNVAFTGFASLVAAEAVRALIGREVARLAGPGAIAAIRLIDRKLEPEDPELTPLMKLKRHVVLGQYGDLIDDIYRAA